MWIVLWMYLVSYWGPTLPAWPSQKDWINPYLNKLQEKSRQQKRSGKVRTNWETGSIDTSKFHMPNLKDLLFWSMMFSVAIPTCPKKFSGSQELSLLLTTHSNTPTLWSQVCSSYVLLYHLTETVPKRQHLQYGNFFSLYFPFHQGIKEKLRKELKKHVKLYIYHLRRCSRLKFLTTKNPYI